MKNFLKSKEKDPNTWRRELTAFSNKTEKSKMSSIQGCGQHIQNKRVKMAKAGNRELHSCLSRVHAEEY